MAYCLIRSKALAAHVVVDDRTAARCQSLLHLLEYRRKLVVHVHECNLREDNGELAQQLLRQSGKAAFDEFQLELGVLERQSFGTFDVGGTKVQSGACRACELRNSSARSASPATQIKHCILGCDLGKLDHFVRQGIRGLLRGELSKFLRFQMRVVAWAHDIFPPDIVVMGRSVVEVLLTALLSDFANAAFGDAIPCSLSLAQAGYE
mmetsp:Transcript_78667/g.218435  ORF Transcript_78667/g.218435 Transcript_78667/m.218435 type:complete len:207 (-) Transcript_78667:76-696(-)